MVEKSLDNKKNNSDEEIRLDSFISQHGFCSRRKVKELLEKRQITVNGIVAKSMMRIKQDKDVVKVGNKDIKKNINIEYILLNKPINVLSTTIDTRGRRTVLDFVKTKNRLYPVGRLDYNSTGLILLTNDGDLALKITHPRYHVEKKYVVVVDKNITEDFLKSLKNGVEIYDSLTMPTIVKKNNNREFEITLFEGKKRQIREMCRVLGYETVSLRRVSMGNLSLGDLELGESRALTAEEIKGLKNLVER